MCRMHGDAHGPLCPDRGGLDRAADAAPESRGEEPEGFWFRLVQDSPNPTLVLDASYRCVFASRSMTAETGVAEETLLGRGLASIVVDADGSSIDERLDRTEVGVWAHFGVSLATASGETLHTRAIARRDVRDGEPVYIVVLRSVMANGTAESALRRRVDLELLLERVQHRFIHAVPLEIPAVISWALEEVGRFLGADRSYVLTFDHDARTETMIHEWVRPGTEPELGEYIDVSWDLVPAATRRNNDQWVSAVPDVSKLEGEWELDRQFFEESGLRSILELPIIVDGHPVGGLGFDWLQELADWTEDDLTLLGMFASTFAQLLGREAAERELTFRSQHDELTGLPNRVGLLARLQESLDAHRSTGVIGAVVVDVDRFKVVNDSLGNAAGDELLRLVGARIRGTVRPTESVARLGGDEFAVVISGPDEWAISRAANRVREELARPFKFRGRSYLLTASCGIATTSGGPLSAEELLRRAGAAMYHAKELGRARQSTFDIELEQRLADRLVLDQELRVALERREFEVHYQPEVDLENGRIVGAEALLRWRTDGVLRDAYTFIDVVEETGLIVPVGRWVLDEACRTVARWRSMGVDPDFAMRVNLSPRQLEDPDLVDLVGSALARYGLDPHNLCLEITETALMTDAEASLAVLQRLDTLGVALAIDDFGTGYSSLSYLKRFPVDILKIDRSFVDGLPVDEEDAAIVSTVVSLAMSLGMTVTAEGVETPEQADTLVGLGCGRGQGWLYSKAVPGAVVESGFIEVRPA